MRKQVIVVVHGVGVRQAGVSSDLLSASLDSNPPAGKDGRTGFDHRSSNALREDALRPVSTDDFILREPRKYGDNSKYSTFPARIRRYRTQANDTLSKQDDVRERVISDFYWGDVTGTGGTFLQVLTGVFRLMLGLTHALRENAWAVFPDPHGRPDWIGRKAAGTAALIVHGPLFALNLMLAVFALALGGMNAINIWEPNAKPQFLVISDYCLGFGWLLALGVASAGLAGLAWVRRWPFYWVFLAAGLATVGFGLSFLVGNDDQILGLLALLTIAAGVVLRLLSRAFLLRHLADWLVICALGFLAVLAAPGLQGNLLDFVSPDGSSRAIKLEESQVVQALAAVVILAALACWAVVVLIALGMLFRRIFVRNGAVDFQAEAIALIMLLWLVVTGAFWGFGLKLAQKTGVNWGGDTDLVYNNLLFVPVAIGMFLALLALMGATYLATRRRSDSLEAVRTYLDHRAERAEAGRLVVAKAGIWFLRAVVVCAGLVVILGAMNMADWIRTGPAIDQLLDCIRSTVGVSLSALAAVGALAIGFGRGVLGAAIGIVIDVVSYINNFSWNSWDDLDKPKSEQLAIGPRQAERVTVAQMQPSRTIFETILPWLIQGDRAPKAKGYWMRRRIQDRMRVLVAELLRDEEPDELLIIAHSQGTMIAADVIEMEGRGWLEFSKGKLTKIGLVTMGSPLRHVYSTYFKRSFPLVQDRPNLQSRENGGVLSDWTNIFRIDDFIGTYIADDTATDSGEDCSAQWPREIPVPRNGHTMYWVDMNVSPHLRRLAAF